MGNKYFADTAEKIEVISYQPGIQDSGNLEAGAKTVTAAAKPGEPDYSADLTVPAPDDARFIVKRVGVRLQLTIDSMSAGHLFGAVYVNGVERKTFDMASAGECYVVQYLVEGQFNLGVPNSYQVFLWVDSGQAVIGVCRLWQAVGTTDNGYNYPFCLQLKHEGFLQFFVELNRIGSGNIEVRIGHGTAARPSIYSMSGSQYALFIPPLMLSFDNGVGMRVNNVGDMGYFYSIIKAILRSEL